eukprot:gnl/MRDRNA2_/MRDRNA2_168346_c0_seq1.p1 gnl/MRDRNA2_/MRDRNA2_168346_c0~~gnl/MRDRNA2_/MRDRNA2_168346_c0_seq1.p1  ORF type:complete len:763 (-),score=146.89 gnl/MRDRNA2_/MRDRNA2_168346_c0_seq1:134-2422(-)
MAETIKVAVRVRPFNEREIGLGSICIVSMKGKTTSVKNHKHEYRSADADDDFSRSYDYSYWSVDPADDHFVDQAKVFSDIGTAIVNNSLKGFNCCLFAYGQTGSGKSYSVIGYPPDLGLIPRTVEAIFKEKDISDSKPDDELRIWISFIEIYNETVRDLLFPTQVELKVLEQPNMGICIPGLTEEVCRSASEVDQLMDFGTKKRVVGATNMNATSSRSHAVFTIKVQRLTGAKPRVIDGFMSSKDERTILSSKINLVDLAGSERVNKTGTSGSTMKEGCVINQSLSSLGLVIKELSEGKAVAPFRSSKLTFLLKDSLAGNSKTFMMAAISPAADNFDETLSTLRFASSVKMVKTVAKVNIDAKDQQIRSLQAEIAKLKKRLASREGDKALQRLASAVSLDRDSSLTEAMKARDKLLEEINAKDKLLEGMKHTYEDQVKMADEMMSKRKAALEDMGLTMKEISELSGMDKDTPLLQNLSDDPTISGCLVYFLRKDTSSTIGASTESTIELSGLGIPDKLCHITNQDNSSLTISLSDASQNADDAQHIRIVVNGHRLKQGEPAYRLKHNDVIHLGWAFRMRLIIPGSAQSVERKKTVAAEEDQITKLLFPEDSQAAMEFRMTLEELCNNLSETRQIALHEDLTKAAYLVDEANAITQEMRPDDRLSLRIQLIKDVCHDTIDLFCVCVMKLRDPRAWKLVGSNVRASDGGEVALPAAMVCCWTYSQFQERIEQMRDCFDILRSQCQNSDSIECPRSMIPAMFRKG